LDWTRPAWYLDRQVRACDPWPGAYTTWQGQRLKVLRARPRLRWSGPARARPRLRWSGPAEPGQVLALDGGLGVGTGEGVLELLVVQLAGKNPLQAETFARGQRSLIGSRLGT